jgi:hypothetical protein
MMLLLRGVTLLLLCAAAAAVDSSSKREPAKADEAALETAAATGNPAALTALAASRHADALRRAAHSPNEQEPTLALLRSAVRLTPMTPAYWNDLGVFEMRCGLHAKSVQRFRRAIGLEAPAEYGDDGVATLFEDQQVTHAEAVAAARVNLERLRAVYWDDAALEKALLHDHDRVQIEHGLTNLTRVRVDDLTKVS